MLRADPCGARLLRAFAPGDGVHLVGGAVRDLLLERTPRELDLVVEGDVDAAAARLGGEVTAHDRFGTARVRAGGCAYDLVRARAETYAHPGALPDVRPGSLDEDLRRRDVTVNAIALGLDGALSAVDGALEDLRAGRLRVLHDASFVDDPTRVWRVARYAARLGFDVEERTRALAGAADPATVSGDRLGSELRLALNEPDPPAALQAVRDLNRAYLPEGFDPRPRGLSAALALLPDDGRADLLTLAACSAGMDAGALLAWLDDMGFVAAERDLVAAASRFSHGRAAARRAHQRRDRAGGAGRAGGGGRAGRRRERAPLAGRAAPRAPGDQRRRPAGRRHPAGPRDRRPAAAHAGPQARRRARRPRAGAGRSARRRTADRLGADERQRAAVGRRTGALRGLLPLAHRCPQRYRPVDPLHDALAADGQPGSARCGSWPWTATDRASPAGRRTRSRSSWPSAIRSGSRWPAPTSPIAGWPGASRTSRGSSCGCRRCRRPSTWTRCCGAPASPRRSSCSPIPTSRSRARSSSPGASSSWTAPAAARRTCGAPSTPRAGRGRTPTTCARPRASRVRAPTSTASASTCRAWAASWDRARRSWGASAATTSARPARCA